MNGLAYKFQSVFFWSNFSKANSGLESMEVGKSIYHDIPSPVEKEGGIFRKLPCIW